MKVKRTTDFFRSYHGDFVYDKDDPEVLEVKKDTLLSGKNIRLYTDTDYYTITAEEFRYYLRTGDLIILDEKGSEV
ncbi:MAG TPA: hypothetical protein PKL44_00325 [Candidatus Dojkabacteria bacterium]|nr:hypothetical protein [Candidatus Dojkabacteria bacterium]